MLYEVLSDLIGLPPSLDGIGELFILVMLIVMMMYIVTFILEFIIGVFRGM